MIYDENTTEHDELRGLCASYALGALDPPELKTLEAHLSTGCATCDAEIASYGRTISAMGALLGKTPPPPTAKERFLARLAAEPGEAAPDIAPDRLPSEGRSLGRWLLPAAAVIVMTSTLWVAVESRREVVRLRAELEAFETTTDPLVRILDLRPTPYARGARARVTFDPRTDTWRLFVHDLAPAPEGMDYQGWLMTQEGPLSFGVFQPDASRHSFLALNAAEGAGETMIRVTLEPTGGSRRPQGPPVFEPAPAGTSPD